MKFFKHFKTLSPPLPRLHATDTPPLPPNCCFKYRLYKRCTVFYFKSNSLYTFAEAVDLFCSESSALWCAFLSFFTPPVASVLIFGVALHCLSVSPWFWAASLVRPSGAQQTPASVRRTFGLHYYAESCTTGQKILCFMTMRKVELLCWNDFTVLLWGIWITSGAKRRKTFSSLYLAKMCWFTPPPQRKKKWGGLVLMDLIYHFFAKIIF